MVSGMGYMLATMDDVVKTPYSFVILGQAS